ncbi:MAG: hypothetical protein GX575_28895 [Candidatus Anammoximicrobium sp.]|nr:hypothetical protein [Candidatus Anammoximicrobium sp.]
MWRSVFLAIGVSFCILGLECLVVDAAVLAESAPGSVAAMDAYSLNGAGREIKTEEWMPWSFLATGTVIILYSITLPKRFQAA